MSYPEQRSSVLALKGVNSFMWSVDYLRLTRPKGESSKSFYIPTRVAVSDSIDQGHKKRPYAVGDMRGVICGNVAYAESKTHWLSEFRGGLAEVYYPDYINVTSNCTRLDLALTVWLDDYQANLAVEFQRLAVAHHEKMGWGNSRAWPLLIHSRDGDTCYLGSRSSDRYFRFYDKHKRSKDEWYKNAWRFELETKGDLSKILWQDIQQEADARYIANREVIGTLDKRGIALADFPVTQETRKIPYVDTPKDVTSRLLWLQKQVKPALDELSKRGYLDAALAVLGLVDVTLPKNDDEA